MHEIGSGSDMVEANDGGAPDSRRYIFIYSGVCCGLVFDANRTKKTCSQMTLQRKGWAEIGQSKLVVAFTRETEFGPGEFGRELIA